MEAKQSGEIMIPLDKYPHIPYWFTLRQAIVEMEKTELDINGQKSTSNILLVFDKKYQLLGIVRQKDIIHGLDPEFLHGISLRYKKRFNLNEIIKNIKEKAERQVSDVMTFIKVAVDYEDSIIKALYEMIENDISLIPVLKNKKVIGVVRIEDVFHEVANLILR